MYLKKTDSNNNYPTWVILKNSSNDNYFINLTPACDIAQNKMEFYKLYKIVNYPTSRNKKDKMKKLNSKYFLEESKIFENWWVIDFEYSISVSKDEISNYEKICYVSTFFLKDIVANLWNYYNRQWSPDFHRFG